MDISNINDNIKFGDIFNAIEARTKILREIDVLDEIINKKMALLKSYDKDIVELNINVDTYIEFFKKYDIYMNAYNFVVKPVVYRVKEINLIKFNNTSTNKDYYNVTYKCMCAESYDIYEEGNMELVSYMHLLSHKEAKIIKAKN